MASNTLYCLHFFLDLFFGGSSLRSVLLGVTNSYRSNTIGFRESFVEVANENARVDSNAGNPLFVSIIIITIIDQFIFAEKELKK